MWALLDNDGKVLTAYPPDFNQEQMFKEADGRRLIEMTVENSPAYLNGIYKDGKFYPPKEIDNG
jgi:hypothetical protein